MKTTLYTPFIEAGFSPNFAQFCILHDLQVEWTRDPWNARLRVELFRMVEPSAAAYRIARPEKVREVVAGTVIDNRELQMGRGDDMGRHLEEVLKGHASEYLLQAKGVKPSEYAAAHDARDNIRYNMRTSDFATGYIGSSAFMEKLIRAEHEKKRRQAEERQQYHQHQEQAKRERDDHASDAFRYGGRAYDKTWTDEWFQQASGARMSDEARAAWEEIFKRADGFRGFDPAGAQPSGKSFTKEQQAARTRARKIKALMNGTTHAGERASAKSRLDNILSKHSLTEADI